MPDRPSVEPVVAIVPARSDAVHVLRSVAASVAARSALTVDSIEDLRIAVDEASAQLLAAVPEASTLTMTVRAEAVSVDVQLCVDADAPVWPPEGLEGTLGWKVLNGLADEVRYERLAEGPSVRVRKHGLGGTGR